MAYQISRSVQDFVSLLQEVRTAKKMSQRELAKLVGAPQSHLSNIEKGRVDLRLSSFIEISRTLGLEPMLIPIRYVAAVKGLMEAKKHGESFEPAFVLDDEEDEDA